MELTIGERFMALGALPPKADIVSLRLIQEMTAKIGFSAEDIEEFGLVTEVAPNGQMNSHWDEAHADTVREIALAPAELELLKKELAKLDKAGELTLQHVSLYDKVCPSGSG